MSKDPAFLFYSSDFLTGTMFFSMEEKGEYITLLCVQHQSGRIAKKNFFSICGQNSKVIDKFKVDENGFYYNEVLEGIAAKRKEFSESRRKNRLGKVLSKTHDKQVNKTSKTSVSLVENVNVNEIETVITYLNSVIGSNYKTGTKSTRQSINARISEGFTVDNFKTVIFKKNKEWKNTEYEKHLTPATLFAASNFEKYLNQTGNFTKPKTRMELEDDSMADLIQYSQQGTQEKDETIQRPGTRHIEG